MRSYFLLRPKFAHLWEFHCTPSFFTLCIYESLENGQMLQQLEIMTVAPLAPWLMLWQPSLLCFAMLSYILTTFPKVVTATSHIRLFHGLRLYEGLEVLERSHHPKDAKYGPNLVSLCDLASSPFSVKLLDHCLTSHDAMPLGKSLIVGLSTLGPCRFLHVYISPSLFFWEWVDTITS